MAKVMVSLGDVQETLLIPLYGRALETVKRRPALRDPKAVELVESIDYDFNRFGKGPSLLGTVLRTLVFDHWVQEFLDRNPDGTVVDIGSGLNSRFDRLDNGRVHWFDLDLPDVITLRRRFYADTDRRRMIAGSVLDPEWTAVVGTAPGPYLFVAEAVLPYLPEDRVRSALTAIAEWFPGAGLALDTCGPAIVDNQDTHDTLKTVRARMIWTCADPAAIPAWGIGLRLTESRTLATPPAPVRRSLPLRYRMMAAVLRHLGPPRLSQYKVNLFTT